MKMSKIAPASEVITASWFDPSANNGKPTRRHRYRFAISGHISDSVMAVHPELDTAIVCKLLNDKVDLLSKFTHISANTTNIQIEDSIRFQGEVEEVVIEYVMAIQDTTYKIRNIIAGIIEPELNTTLHQDTPAELDALSSGTVFENAYLEQVSEINFFVSPIQVKGTGNVDVQLNYGKGDDGASFDDNYPFSFTAEIDPGSLLVENVMPSIDTSSFYE